ncbi:MAG: hypothetical protein ABJ056_10270 [Halioglobus sp.]
MIKANYLSAVFSFGIGCMGKKMRIPILLPFPLLKHSRNFHANRGAQLKRLETPELACESASEKKILEVTDGQLYI